MIEKIRESIKDIEFYNSINDLFINNSLNKLVIIDKSMIMKSFPNKWMSNKIKEAFMCENYESTYTSGSTSERMQIVRPKDWWKGEYKRTANYNKYLMQKEINNWKKAILTTAICSNMACYLETPSYEERIIHNTLFLNILHMAILRKKPQHRLQQRAPQWRISVQFRLPEIWLKPGSGCCLVQQA